jgi:hypothetical protein
VLEDALGVGDALVVVAFFLAVGFLAFLGFGSAGVFAFFGAMAAVVLQVLLNVVETAPFVVVGNEDIFVN